MPTSAPSSADPADGPPPGFLAAAASGRVDDVARFTLAGHDPQPALAAAAGAGHAAVVAALIDAGAEPDPGALHKAAAIGAVDVLRLLVAIEPGRHATAIDRACRAAIVGRHAAAVGVLCGAMDPGVPYRHGDARTKEAWTALEPVVPMAARTVLSCRLLLSGGIAKLPSACAMWVRTHVVEAGAIAARFGATHGVKPDMRILAMLSHLADTDLAKDPRGGRGGTTPA